MNTEPEHTHVPLRYRNLISLAMEDADATIEIDHVYLPEGQAGQCCHEGCDNAAHDPGMVGITIAAGDEEDGSVTGALLTAEQALIIANRLTRAANLVLESEEDIADIEREAARYTKTSASQERGAA